MNFLGYSGFIFNKGGLFTGWIILGLIIVLLLVMLFSRVKIHIFVLRDGFIKVKYLFLKFTFNFNNITNKEIASSKKDKKADKKTNDKNYIKKLFDEKGTLDAITELIAIIKLIFEKIFKLIKKVEITKLDLFAEFSNGNAAETAMSYGGVCAVLYPVLGWINATFKVKNQKVDVRTVYTDEKKLDFCFETVLKIRVISIISVALSFLWRMFADNINIKANRKVD